MDKQIVIVGSGVTGILCATKLVEEGYPGHLITIIDKGKDPFTRKNDELMNGFLGAGLFSDGKIAYLHNQIGGYLSKYCGKKKAEYLVEELLYEIKSFHPDPDKISFSNPLETPDFIKPYFQMRLAPVYHIGTDYLHEIGKRWYSYLLSNKVKFKFNTTVNDIDFSEQLIYCNNRNIYYDTLIYATGKDGIDLTQKLITNNKLKTEPKPIQIGVRFESQQKYFQKILDLAYDFKLYKEYKKDKINIRTFCVNSNAAYVVEENTYGMKSYNGQSYKSKDKINNMINFGIIMEIGGIENPFKTALDLVKNCQDDKYGKKKNYLGKYTKFINKFILDLNKVFHFDNDYTIYVPEVKYLTDEVIVNYNDLSLIDYPNVHFGGDALSARGIAVAGAQGIYIGEGILKNDKKI